VIREKNSRLLPKKNKEIKTLKIGGTNNRNQINLAQPDCPGLNFVHQTREIRYHTKEKKADVTITEIAAGS
jgi:hypothetical protein